MLLEKFSNIIDRSSIGKAVNYRAELIERTDPNRIYVENIRAFFHVPNAFAKWLCEAAVKEGAFEKRIGFLCPNCDSIIGDFADGEQSKERLLCDSCMALNEDRFEFSQDECRIMTFYKVIANG